MSDAPFSSPYQFTPQDGPQRGVLMILPRRYEAFESASGGGIYVWDEKSEGYVWREGVTLDEFMQDH